MNIQDIENVELEACPFCGREAIIVMHPGRWNVKSKYEQEGGLWGTWYVGCPYPFFEDLYEAERCDIAPAACWFAHLDEAIKWWNKRCEAISYRSIRSKYCKDCGLPMSMHK